MLYTLSWCAPYFQPGVNHRKRLDPGWLQFLSDIIPAISLDVCVDPGKLVIGPMTVTHCCAYQILVVDRYFSNVATTIHS